MVRIIIALCVGAILGGCLALLLEKPVLNRELHRGYRKAVSDMMRWSMYYDKDGVKHAVKVTKED
jgi:hypothetical protein